MNDQSDSVFDAWLEALRNGSGDTREIQVVQDRGLPYLKLVPKQDRTQFFTLRERVLLRPRLDRVISMLLVASALVIGFSWFGGWFAVPAILVALVIPPSVFIGE